MMISRDLLHSIAATAAACLLVLFANTGHGLAQETTDQYQQLSQ